MKKFMTIVAMVGLILVCSNFADAQELWGTGSPNWAWGNGPSPIIFKFNTSTGVISSTFSFETFNWMWISGLADSGRYLYASHNIYDSVVSSETHDFKIAKIDRVTGAVLWDISIAGFLGQTYSQVNALEFHNGKLYAVENATSGSTIRGYAMEILLDVNGDIVGAIKGAYVAPYPDCGLDYHDGLWYATSWGYTPPPKTQGSLVFTSPDIMNSDFTQVGTDNSAIQGIGMIDGWEFDIAGNLFAVTWYPMPFSATGVYSIDTTTWTATLMYDLSLQVPSSITSLDGLSEVTSLVIIEEAKVDFKKKPDDDKVSVKGKFVVDGDVSVFEPVLVTIGPFSETIMMEEKGGKGKKGKDDKWEYKRPKGETGIKDMKIDWKKDEAKFDIKIDKLEDMVWSNPVTITIQIGDDLGSETILMKVKKDKWEYKKDHKK